jgi:hypothetical protein
MRDEINVAATDCGFLWTQQTPQNWFQLYLLVLSVKLLGCICHWCLYYLIFMVFPSLKKFILYCLISLLSFSVTNIIFLNKSNKCNQTHSWNNPYGNHIIASRKRKIFFQRFPSCPQYPHLLQGLSSLSCTGYQGLFHRQKSTATVA